MNQGIQGYCLKQRVENLVIPWYYSFNTYITVAPGITGYWAFFSTGIGI
jgi:hypothetical protein